MKKILKKVAAWGIFLGLSFLNAKQGAMFMWLYTGFVLVTAAVSSGLMLFVATRDENAALECKRFARSLALATASLIGGIFLAAWVLCEVCRIDYYLAYQITTLVACLLPEKQPQQKEIS